MVEIKVNVKIMDASLRCPTHSMAGIIVRAQNCAMLFEKVKLVFFGAGICRKKRRYYLVQEFPM
jgi:hypothetical protein